MGLFLKFWTSKVIDEIFRTISDYCILLFKLLYIQSYKIGDTHYLVKGNIVNANIKKKETKKIILF